MSNINAIGSAGRSVDLLMENDDIAFDDAGEPILIAGIDSITQDIRHLIRETGILMAIIGERSPVKVAALLTRIELAVEDDRRIVPGTVAVQRLNNKTFMISANSDAGAVTLSVPVE